MYCRNAEITHQAFVIAQFAKYNSPHERVERWLQRLALNNQFLTMPELCNMPATDLLEVVQTHQCSRWDC